MQISVFNLSIDRPSNTIDFYEAAIANDETIVTNYWHLGIAYLLAGREDDAQAAWFTPLASASESEIDDFTDDLIAILDRAAQDLAQANNIEQSWLIRKHIWTLVPERVENILHLICLANTMGILTAESLIEWQVKELLQTNTIDHIDEDLLEEVIGASLSIFTEESAEIIKSCLQLMTTGRTLVMSNLMGILSDILNQSVAAKFVVKIVEICNDIQPNTPSTLQFLSYVYSVIGLHNESIVAANNLYQLASKPFDILRGSYHLQIAYFTAGNWQEIEEIISTHEQLLLDIIKISPQSLEQEECRILIISSFFLPYIKDNPLANKTLRNQLAIIYQKNKQLIPLEPEVNKSSLQKKPRCLRVGYIGIGLKSHSVGWLMRWLIHHHNREFFQVFIYCVNTNEADSFNHRWFRDKVDATFHLSNSIPENIAQIKADEIDILIDLDSITSHLTCLMMAYKPAPIQVSWLGWDSSGIPAIDYFIADPYVLPDDAQEYYSEKIWRLPQTYLAVDGFEIGTPTLLREDLDIPADAIVYLSSQSGYKRHPDCIRAQMEIIKAVPNSYFLIKGTSDATTVQNFFSELAIEVDLSLDRLRFLERDINEYAHRANLAIADIVLDTFPYNGATTTLEILWMGIPMVTQVGQQFAARNSYTFMLNAGIEEGIAWSQAEYIEWGIKLGLDRDLRDKIAGKLRSGRITAPVWNAKQFTLDMEQAYRDMWAKYQNSPI